MSDENEFDKDRVVIAAAMAPTDMCPIPAVIEAVRLARRQRDDRARTRWPVALDEIDHLRMVVGELAEELTNALEEAKSAKESTVVVLPPPSQQRVDDPLKSPGTDERNAVFHVLGHERRGGCTRVRVPDQGFFDQVGLVYTRPYEGWRRGDYVRIDGSGGQDGVYLVMGTRDGELQLKSIGDRA